MKTVITVGLIIILFLTVILIIEVRFLNQGQYLNPEQKSLSIRIKEFLRALKDKDATRIYALFNNTFQREVNQTRVEEALTDWYNQRKIKRMKLGPINIFGLGGHISTWFTFHNSSEMGFIYQYWVKTDNGWKLLWLSNFLNQSFLYGVSDTIVPKRIIPLMIKTITEEPGLSRVFPKMELGDRIAFLKNPLGFFYRVNSLKTRVFWISKEDVLKHARPLKINAVFNIALIRVIENIAIVSLDIIPIKSAVPPSGLTRTRGIQLFFKQTATDWEFAGYGVKW